MDDRLENHIREWRDHLDQVEQPDRLALWNRIRQQQTKTGKRRQLYLYPWLHLAAASVLLLFFAGAGWWWLNAGSHQMPGNLHAGLPDERRLELDTRFRLVQQKEKELQLEQVDKAAFGEWFAELATLDSLQNNFAADLNSLPKDDRTADMLLQYYEQKTRILELFSKEIQLQQHEKERLAWNRG